jgi:hypothetical protein
VRKGKGGAWFFFDVGVDEELKIGAVWLGLFMAFGFWLISPKPKAKFKPNQTDLIDCVAGILTIWPWFAVLR